MLELSDLPALNAGLNGLAGVLLLAGYGFVRRKRIAAHRACMLAAFAASTLFLVSYLTYHYNYPIRAFQGEGAVSYLYYFILITHVVLAIVIVPMALLTLYRALRGQFDKHRRLARRTLPIWLYVSVTGVVVYLMLYQL